MKLKNKKIITSLVVVLTLAVIAALGIIAVQKNRQTVFGNDCSATFSMRDKSSNFAANLNVYLNLRTNNTGYVDMTGTVNSKGSGYTAARAYGFEYTLQNGNTLPLTTILLNKRAADTADDNLMDRLIFSIDSSSGRYVKITALNNAWTIGNLYSPLFVCVINEA